MCLHLEGFPLFKSLSFKVVLDSFCALFLGIIYKVHDEEKDKAFELEMSWVCNESRKQREKVSDALLEEAKAAARAALEEMDAH
ncbi:hypothetical protein SLE2022_352640 [Rubroshorea leprosula]